MRLVRALLLVPFLVACGGGTTANGPGRVTTPFTAEHATFFDGAVDYVSEPGDLLGRWREDWARDLSNRTFESDLIAIVRVGQLREAVDLDRRASFLFTGDVHSVLVGDEDVEEISFTVSETEAGYDTIEGNQQRILDHDFVAFVKWAERSPGGEVVARWHLSPASQHVVTEVQSAILHRRRIERRQGSASAPPASTEQPAP